MPLAWYMACQPTHRPVSSSYTLMKKVGFYTLGATVAEAIEENGDTLQQQLDKLEAQGRIPVVVRSPDATQKRWPVSTCGSLSHTDDRVIACAGWQAGRLAGWQADYNGIGIDIEKRYSQKYYPLYNIWYSPNETKYWREA